LITDVLKNLDGKRMWLFRLMLPVVEDSVLAKGQLKIDTHAGTASDLLSRTGLDVVPIPGDTKRKPLKGF
jgi:hypothetical protein